MKKILITLLITLGVQAVQAQKFAYVDTDYILQNVPEFKKAQEELDKTSTAWQKEVEAKYKEIEALYKAFQADLVVLTDDMRKNRENEIVEKERLAKEFQKSKFGLEGELFQKRQELIKPIQDKVFAAIKEVAASSQLDMVLDKAADHATILFADPKLDKSDLVLRKMGIKRGVE